MRQKMINLDPTAYEMAKEIAKKHGGFSKWVRDMIHKEFNKGQKVITTAWRWCQKCGYGNNSGLAWCRKCDSKDPMVTRRVLDKLRQRARGEEE